MPNLALLSSFCPTASSSPHDSVPPLTRSLVCECMDVNVCSYVIYFYLIKEHMENLTDEQLSERFDDIEAVLERLRRSELRAQQAQQRAQQAEQQAQQRAQQAEEQAQQAQQRAQHVLRTAEFAVLAACEVLMSSGRYVEAISLQPWLHKLHNMQIPIASGDNGQEYIDDSHAQRECRGGHSSRAEGIRDYSWMAWVGSAANARECFHDKFWCTSLKTYRHNLLKLSNRIGLN